MTGNSDRKPKDVFSAILNVERHIRALKAVLNCWVYGVNKTSFTKTGNFLYAEEATRENAMVWIKNILGWKIGKTSPSDTIEKYVDAIGETFFINKNDLELKEDRNGLTITYKPDGKCIYLESCKWLTSEMALDIEAPCPRAIIFAVAIEMGCGVRHKVEIISKELGKICVMRFTPT